MKPVGCPRCGNPRARSSRDHTCALGAHLGIDDIEKFQRATINSCMGRCGGRLDPSDYEDLLAYLVILAWRLMDVYDPSEGISFSRFLRQTSEKRVSDWYRRRKTSRRLKHVDLGGKRDCGRCGAPRETWDDTSCSVSFDALDPRLPSRGIPFEEEVVSRLATAA